VHLDGSQTTHGNGRDGAQRPPGWSVCNVKFNTGNFGKEIMAFTSLIDLVDARTFETDEVIRLPTVSRRSPPPPASRPQQIRPVPPPLQQQQQTTFLHQQYQLFAHRFSTQLPCLWAVQPPETAYDHPSCSVHRPSVRRRVSNPNFGDI